MAFDPTLSQPVDRVRRAVGDTSDVTPILPEVTYLAALTLSDNEERRATIYGAEWLITRLSQDPDKVEVTGAVKVEWANRIKSWRALANGLRVDLGLPTLGETDSTMRIGYLTRTTDTATEFGG